VTLKYTLKIKENIYSMSRVFGKYVLRSALCVHRKQKDAKIRGM
jgi:hypothetical protein